MSKIAYITDLSHEGIEGVDIHDIHKLDLSNFAYYDAIFVRYNKYYKEVVKRIRRYHSLDIYLKPIYLFKQINENVIEYGIEILDGIIETPQIYRYYQSHKAVIDKINDRIKDLLIISREFERNEFSMALKVLRYMYTRQKPLKPVRFVKSIYGYSYPNVNVNFSGNSFQEFTLINFLEKRGLIKGDFVDRIFSCSSCYSSYLNFREICTNCGSPNISSQDLIHHYVCGYLGQESDYHIEGTDELKCPKCKKFLKHIGVDYDRPSELYTCASCGHQFQEADVDSHCINCGAVTGIDKLIQRDIREYSLTAIGENSAIHGIMFSLKDELSESLNIVDQSKLNVIVKMEYERIFRYKKSTSTLVKMHFLNYLEILKKYGENSIEISYEIGKVIKETIRKSDLISFIDQNTFILLLVETSLSGAEKLIERLEADLSEINLKNLDINLEAEHTYVEIDGETSYDKILKKLLTDV
jgi:GGDEF domain-containing protein/DNA-directed RNA polymerase subunit M/transcription elongation factor TFIIS